MMRPNRGGRAAQGSGGSEGSGKLNALFGSLMGGQEQNVDFSNPGGHDFTDAKFDANTQQPFEKQGFWDRLNGKPDQNAYYQQGELARQGALANQKDSLRYQQQLGHQEQNYQQNKLAQDLATYAQMANAGRGPGQPLTPVLSPQEYNFRYGTRGQSLGIPMAEADAAGAENQQITTRAQLPYAGPTAEAQAQGGLSTAQRGALEAKMGYDYRQSPQGQSLYNAGQRSHDLIPTLQADKMAIGNAGDLRELPGKGWVHTGLGVSLDPYTGTAYSVAPPEKGGEPRVFKDEKTGKTSIQYTHPSAGQVSTSRFGGVPDPSGAGMAIPRSGALVPRLNLPSAGVFDYGAFNPPAQGPAPAPAGTNAPPVSGVPSNPIRTTSGPTSIRNGKISAPLQPTPEEMAARQAEADAAMVRLKAILNPGPMSLDTYRRNRISNY